MANQTLTIVNTLDDGYQTGASTWASSTTFIGGPSPTNICGLSFVTTAAIAAGSTIDKAYVRVYRLATDSSMCNVPTIRVENADPASNTRWSASHLPSGATYFTAATVAAFNWIDYRNQWLFGEADTFPCAITAAIQALVDGFGAIETGERINVNLLSTINSSYGNIEDLAAAGGHAAQLYIEWTAGPSGNPSFYYAQQ